MIEPLSRGHQCSWDLINWPMVYKAKLVLPFRLSYFDVVGKFICCNGNVWQIFEMLNLFDSQLT